jgi:hypothetical protein
MTPVVSEWGVTVAECDAGFAAVLGADRTSVILLRPDRYVAACFPLQQAEIAAQAVQELLNANWREATVGA